MEHSAKVPKLWQQYSSCGCSSSRHGCDIPETGLDPGPVTAAAFDFSGSPWGEFSGAGFRGEKRNTSLKHIKGEGSPGVGGYRGKSTR